MPTLNNLLTKWRLWINRDHTFQQDELKELQSHLMEEINYLINREGFSEEEAFHKAVSLVGEREGLDQEYVKVKSAPNKIVHWAKVNPWSVSATILILVIVSSYFAWYRPLAQENMSLRNDLGYIKTYPGPFKPLKGIDIFGQSIVNPKLEWMKEIKQVDDGPPGLTFDLSVTQDGDVFVAPDQTSYSYSKKTMMSFIPTKGAGISSQEYDQKDFFSKSTKRELCKNFKKISYFFVNQQNQLHWRSDGTDFIVGPDNMLYDLNKNGTISSYDSMGKLRWCFQIPIKNININFQSIDAYFFDTNANFYVLVPYNDDTLTMFIISPKSNSLIQNDFPKTMFKVFDMFSATNLGVKMVENDLNGKIFTDQFFVFTASADQYFKKIENSIIAYGFNGKQKWVFSYPGIVSFNSEYLLDSNSSIYLLYRNLDNRRSYLQSISSQGKLLWEKEIRLSGITKLINDHQGNIYIGSKEVTGYTNEYPNFKVSILCLNPDGTLKWSWETDKTKNILLRSNLVFGPNGSIFFIVQEDFSKLYCVKLASSK